MIYRGINRQRAQCDTSLKIATKHYSDCCFSGYILLAEVRSEGLILKSVKISLSSTKPHVYSTPDNAFSCNFSCLSQYASLDLNLLI